MNFLKKTFFVVLAGLLIFSSPVLAKESSGKITGINTNENFLIVQTVDESGKPGQVLMLKASNGTRWDGVKSLKDLSMGDLVTFNASKGISGAWKLKSLSKKPVKVAPVSTSGGGSAMAMGGYNGH